MLSVAAGDEFFLGHDGELRDRGGLGEDDALVDGDFGLDLEDLLEGVTDVIDAAVDGAGAGVDGEENDGGQGDEDEADAEIVLHGRSFLVGQATQATAKMRSGWSGRRAQASQSCFGKPWMRTWWAAM